MKKKCISLLLSAITAFGCVAMPACDIKLDGDGGIIQGELTQISAPKNVRVENGIVKWSAVSNADSYIVQVGDEGNQAVTTELQMPLSMILSGSLNNFYVKVKAKPSSSILFSESEWSAAAGPYNYEGSNSSSGGTTDNDSTSDEKTQISWDDPIVQNGVGTTVNAISGKYIDMYAGVDAGVLDMQKLYQLPLYKFDLNENIAYYSEGESFEEYCDQYSKTISTKFSNSVNAGVGIPGVFSLNAERSFSSSFSSSVKTERKESTREYYYTHSQVYKNHRIWISGANNKKTFTNILSNAFLQEAKSILTEEDAADFFRTYGTHLVTTAFLGGKIDITCNIVTNNSSFTKEKAREISLGLKNAAGASIPIDGVQVEAGGSTESSINSALQTINTSEEGTLCSELKIYAQGGTILSFMSFDELKNDFKQWIETVPDNLALIDVPDGSLMSLWDILPSTDEYKTARNLLEQCFKSQCSTSYAEKLNRLYGDVDLKFDGGTGTSTDPYLISTRDQLKKVAYKMGSHFKLTQDIDLGHWTPLGTTQWKHTAKEDNPEDPFRGTLDGDGYTLIYSSAVTGIDSANDGAWGLFGSSNGASFKNLKLKATIYSCPPDPKAENVDACEFSMGALVGLAIDTNFDNCELLSGSIISNKKTDSPYYQPFAMRNIGATYTGGLVGDARADSTFTNCINNGTVYSHGYFSFAGGLVGNAYQTTIQGCINNGEVTSVHSGYYMGWGESAFGDIVGKEIAPWLIPDGKGNFVSVT